MSVSLKIAHFSQQAVQIIRYLAINAEAEGSKLSLDAEQTAEFFHCLIGYDSFYRGGEQIIVHREFAEPVLICERDKKGYLLHSTVLINGAAIPLRSEKVITGRSGCWLGVSGEYWWIPAVVDVAWMRNFFRASEQACDKESAELLLSGKTFLPVRVIEAKTKMPRQKKCFPLYTGEILEDASFQLEINFIYDGKAYSPDGARLGHSDDFFWKRDSRFEKNAIDELRRFGFAKDKKNHSKYALTLSDIEAVGFFFDIFLKKWNAEERNFYLSEKLLKLSGGGSGTLDLKFKFELFKVHGDSFDLKYSIMVGDAVLDWKTLVKAVKENRSYIFSGGALSGISQAQARFVSSISEIAHMHKNDDEILTIPRFAAPYWAEIAKDIPGAVPQEFHEISAFMKNSASQDESLELLDRSGFEHKFEGELRNYQKQGVAWMKDLAERGFNLILADEMGLGKTIQTLAMLTLNANSKPSLICCPASLVENWKRETNKFVPSFNVLSVNGSNRDELWETADKYDILITSYSLLKRDIDHIKSKHFNYLILDEAQHIKNPFTANAQTCKSVKSEKRLVLTGTPLENSPEDLWSIFDFLHPGLLGNFTAFKNQYSKIHEDKFKQDDLAARVSPFVLRRKKKTVCSELPPKLEQTLYCEMDAEQQELYDRFLIKSREQYKNLFKKNGAKSSNFEILSALLRLRQVCCHPNLLPEKLNDSVYASAKTELLEELVYQNIDSGHKLLIFSQFTSLLKILRTWLDREGLKYEYLDGSTKNRMERVDNFNNSKDIPIFLLSLKAGGTGLNLTSADTVIIYDPWWNPAVEAQATDRSHRIGQTMSVNSIKLVVKNSIEERILKLQKRKQDIFNSLVDNPEAAMKKLDMEDLEFLLG
jgi:SNF2 family DNA or RNA helicase